MRPKCCTNCRKSSCASLLMCRWRLSELQVPGRCPASLDGLPEEQGPKGGAVAHIDQRAATNPQPRLTPSFSLHACRQSLSTSEILRVFNAQTQATSSRQLRGHVYYNMSHHESRVEPGQQGGAGQQGGVPSLSIIIRSRFLLVPSAGSASRVQSAPAHTNTPQGQTPDYGWSSLGHSRYKHKIMGWGWVGGGGGQNMVKIPQKSCRFTKKCIW